MKEYRTKTLIISLRPDDIIELADNKEWNGTETLEVVKEVTAMLKKVVDNQSRGFLVEVANRYISREALAYYQAVEMDCVARALLLNSFGGKVVGNLFLKLFGDKPNEAGRIVPTKLFTKKEEAEEWLLKEIAKHKG